MSNPTLYGPEFSYYLRSMRLLFNYKGIKHGVTNAPLGKKVAFFTEEHAELHPFRKLPVLIEGELVLPETLAIAWYIESKPGTSFIPGDAKQQALILSMASLITQYVHTAIMSNLILEFRFPKGKDGAIRFEHIGENLPQAKTVLAWLETKLAKRVFIVGDQFSLADAYLIPMLDYLDQMPEPFNLVREFEGLNAYLQHHRGQNYCEGILGSP